VFENILKHQSKIQFVFHHIFYTYLTFVSYNISSLISEVRFMVRSAIHIVIADDNDHSRAALANFLQMTEDFVVVGQANDGEEAVQLCAELHPDVALLDASMPVMDGATAARMICHTHSHIRIVVLTATDFNAELEALEQDGMCLYLRKAGSTEQLLNALLAV
jgi:DNA-binding NarL/FixJ family response regulator